MTQLIAPLARMPETSSGAVFGRAKLSDRAAGLLGGTTPRSFLTGLVDADLDQDATSALAAGFTKADAVWWCSLCVYQLMREPYADQERAALRAAVAWVLEPTEPNRAAAEKAALPVDLNHPARWPAQAAAIADPPGSRSTDVANHVTLGIILAVGTADLARHPKPLKHCAVLGIDLADHKFRFPDSAPAGAAGRPPARKS